MTRRRRVAVLVALGGLACIAVVAWFALRFRVGPVDPSVVVLGADGETALRDAFNAHAERTRVVALLSPT